MLALATRGSARDLLLEAEHIEQALAYERPGETAPVLRALQAAALAFFQEVQRRQEGARALELAEAFRGLVLGAAVRQLGRDEALRFFSHEHVIKSRNHHRILHREFEKVGVLCKALGLERSPLADLLTTSEER
jgi:hypothetical protein